MEKVPRREDPHRVSELRWATIMYAISDTRLTVRLCAILLAGSLRIALLIPVIMLIRR